MEIHEYHACGQEQHQFQHGMVNEVQQCTGSGKGIMFAQNPLHSNAHHHKTNLGHGRTCQCPFQIDGEQRQNCTHKHGDHTKDQHEISPRSIMEKDLCGDHHNAEHTGLC